MSNKVTVQARRAFSLTDVVDDTFKLPPRAQSTPPRAKSPLGQYVSITPLGSEKKPVAACFLEDETLAMAKPQKLQRKQSVMVVEDEKLSANQPGEQGNSV